MIDELKDSTLENENRPIIKVLKKRDTSYSVLFPFSDVPVEMTYSYFKKHVNLDKYIVDFEDERQPE
jgi:hypothetical protein